MKQKQIDKLLSKVKKLLPPELDVSMMQTTHNKPQYYLVITYSHADDADFVEDEWDDYVADNIGHRVVNEIGMLKLREQVFEIDCGGNNFVIHSSFDLTPTIVRYDNVSISYCGYIIHGGGMEPITAKHYSCVGSCDNIDKFLSHLRQTQG